MNGGAFMTKIWEVGDLVVQLFVLVIEGVVFLGLPVDAGLQLF
jgi:hypothetical protein